LKIAELFARRPKQIIKGSRVLVCGLDFSLRELFEADLSVYSRHYQSVDAAFFSSISDLLGALERAYDIVHFFCGLSPGGIIADSEGATIIGSEFIAKCCEKDVKLLWVASGNKGDDYIKGFKVNENRLNLVMTLDRRGSRFSEFLEKLLSRVSRGETMPIAWAALAPQARGPWEQDLPSCIFSAGRGSVKLLS
jgi:hypothetical protein